MIVVRETRPVSNPRRWPPGGDRIDDSVAIRFEWTLFRILLYCYCYTGNEDFFVAGAGVRRHIRWAITACFAALLIAPPALAQSVPGVQLEPRGPYGNCSGSSGACNAAGGGPGAEDFIKFKDTFKPAPKNGKTGKYVAKICDIVVYDEVEGGATHMAVVASVDPDGSVKQTLGQNGSPPPDGSISPRKTGNITINPVDTLENDGTDLNWSVYTPKDGADPSDAIKQAQAGADAHNPPDPASTDQVLKWLRLLKLCHDRNLALMNAPKQGAYVAPHADAPPSSFVLFAGPLLAGAIGTQTTTEVFPGFGVTNRFDNSGSGIGGGVTAGALILPFAPNGGLDRAFIGLEGQIVLLNQTIRQSFASGTSIGTDSNWQASLLLMPGYRVAPQIQLHGLIGVSVLNETAKITFSPPGSVNATVPGFTIGAGAWMKIADIGVPVHLFGEVQETWWSGVKQNNGGFQYTYGNRADTRILAGVVFEIPHW
jgi:opacity protein-like surface antigen